VYTKAEQSDHFLAFENPEKKSPRIVNQKTKTSSLKIPNNTKNILKPFRHRPLQQARNLLSFAIERGMPY
jgi:hypothetical protein